MITNSDLSKNLYDIKTIENNIKNLNIKKVIITQNLDIPFIIKYVIKKTVNKSFDEQDSDNSDMNIDTILQFQPHINKEILLEEINKLQ